MSLKIENARPVQYTRRGSKKTQEYKNEVMAQRDVANPNPNKQKFQELTIELKLLNYYIKKYESSTGVKGFMDWVSHKLAKLYGWDNIDTWRQRKIECEKQLQKFKNYNFT